MTSKTTGSVQALVKFARENSPYYRKLYADLPEQVSELNDVPVLDHASFWVANTGIPPENQVITAPLIDGAVFRTGGTTAVPKASFFTREELREAAQSMVACLDRAGLRPGDRVANLLYGGDLYKGFLDLGLALTDAPTPNFHLSIGVAPLESQAWTLRTFAATVLVAMPTIMCRLAEYLFVHRQPVSSVRLVLYVGELLHKDQRILLGKAFPSAKIGPLQYVSVDGGPIGLPDDPPGGIDQDPTSYTVKSANTIMELITDTGDLITKEGVKGNIVITNLTRRLMPVIRYPMGDTAEWIEYSSRRFRLCGRGAIGVRVGPASCMYFLSPCYLSPELYLGGIYFPDVCQGSRYLLEEARLTLKSQLDDTTSLKEIVSCALKDEKVNGFQVLLRRSHGMDEMVFRIACQPVYPEKASQEVQAEMGRVHEEWAKEVAERFVNPLVIEWVSVQDLHFNARSGKLKDIVDLRVI